MNNRILYQIHALFCAFSVHFSRILGQVRYSSEAYKFRVKNESIRLIDFVVSFNLIGSNIFIPKFYQNHSRCEKNFGKVLLPNI